MLTFLNITVKIFPGFNASYFYLTQLFSFLQLFPVRFILELPQMVRYILYNFSGIVNVSRLIDIALRTNNQNLGTGEMIV